MITKPKAKKFRIRRSVLSVFASSRPEAEAPEAAAAAPAPAAAAKKPAPRRAAPDPDAMLFADGVEDDGFGTRKFPTAGHSGEVTSPDEVAADADLEAIRREGLTGRQLRTARRVAQRNGIEATSDLDAVRLLRQKGIDPFQRASMLELVVSDTQDRLPAEREQRDTLPQTVKAPPAPSTEVKAEEARMRDIMRIQQDLARRRRRRMMLLVARLTFFVLLPTFLAGYYYYRIATPFYAAKAAFVINKSDGGGAASPLAGLFSGTQFANSQDSITVQAYLTSRDAMDRLDRDEGFRAVFSAPGIDPLQRLDPGATNEAAYRLYKRNVKIGYDPSEGIVKVEVATPDPEKSVAFTQALISYAEAQVDHMTLRMRDDQMKGARDSYQDAEQKLQEANAKVVALQQQYSVLSSDLEVSLITSQIQALNAELNKDTLDLQQMQSQSDPTQARIDPLKQRIGLIQQQIADLRGKLTKNDGTGESLALIQSQLTAAQAEVQTRTAMLAQSLQALEAARVAANQQTRYLSVGVQPVAPDEPTYPEAFENTIVAFLLFAGLYLMLSMTASILREQVSA